MDWIEKIVDATEREYLIFSTILLFEELRNTVQISISLDLIKNYKLRSLLLAQIRTHNMERLIISRISEIYTLFSFEGSIAA